MSAVNDLASYSDPITRLSASVKGPQQQIVQEMGKSSQEVMPLIDKREEAQKEASKALTAADQKYIPQIEALGAQQQEIPQFTPTPENKNDLLSLFALTAANTFLGGGGRNSGVTAMTNLSSAMQGLNAGRQDLYERELNNYKTNVERVRLQNQQVQEKIKQAMTLWGADKDAAQRKLAEAAAMTDNGLLKHKIRTGDLNSLSQLVQQQEQSQLRHQEVMARLGMQEGKGDQGLLSPDAVDFMADQILAGDRTPFQNLGRGAQGSKNIVALREAVMRKAKERGFTGKQLANMTAEFEGQKALQRALGTRTATAEMAVTEFQQLAPIVLQASADVPRGDFVPLNRAILAGKANLSDPAVRRLNAAINTTVNVYARAISPTGQVTVSDKEHARELLRAADSPEALAEIVDLMMLEAQAAKASPGIVRQDIRELYGEEGGGHGSSTDQAQAEKAFGSYEPDKYEYGINPATGRFARRLRSAE